MTSAGLPVAPYPGVVFATSSTPAQLAALCDGLRGQVVAGITIHDVRAELTSGATGETIVHLLLLLDDWGTDEHLWPAEALREMKDLARDEAVRLGIHEWLFVRHRPLSDPGPFVTVRRAHIGR